MKKIVKYSSAFIISAILLFYGVFAIYLGINELNVSESPVLHDSIYARIKTPHQLTLIDDGLASLYKRLNLINEAKESIELEFFIYELDSSSRLITQSLVAKAKAGVKVRLLVDFSQPIFQLRPVYASFLKQNGIEVKYYNTSSLVDIFSVQHRSHRKLLLIDDKYALTGGRNIGNDYFNLSEHYNFLDSDVLIEGPIVKSIKKSFELYWNSDFAEIPEVTPPSNDHEFKKAIDLISVNPDDNEILKQIFNLSPIFVKAQCDDLSYITDFPGVTEKNRRVFAAIKEVLLKSKKSIIAESPYFVIRHDGLKLLKHFTTKNIDTIILTNSLYSTDAYYTVSALYSALGNLSETNLKLAIFNGNPFKSSLKIKHNRPSKRWGTHAKRAVIDGKTTILGTYNIDPRSANLNSEMIIICRESKDFANLVTRSIGNRMRHSWPLLVAGKYHTKTLIRKADWISKLKFYLVLPLSRMFDFLL